MRASVHLNRFAITRINEVNVCLFETFCIIIYWVRIVQRVGYETSEPGYERSTGTKRLVTNLYACFYRYRLVQSGYLLLKSGAGVGTLPLSLIHI